METVMGIGALLELLIGAGFLAVLVLLRHLAGRAWKGTGATCRSLLGAEAEPHVGALWLRGVCLAAAYTAGRITNGLAHLTSEPAFFAAGAVFGALALVAVVVFVAALIRRGPLLARVLRQSLRSLAHADELRRSAESAHAQMLRITEYLPGHAWEVGTDWKITTSVGRELRQFGLSPEQIRGRDVRGFISEFETEQYARLFAGEADEFEYEKMMPPEAHVENRETRWQVSLRVILHAQHGPSGRVTGVTAYAQPVSQAVRAAVRQELIEEAIGQTSRFFRANGG